MDKAKYARCRLEQQPWDDRDIYGTKEFEVGRVKSQEAARLSRW